VANFATGEQCYSQAKEYILRHDKALEMKEKANQDQQYNNSKSGLQVVKRIVKQSRKERKESMKVQIDFTKGNANGDGAASSSPNDPDAAAAANSTNDIANGKGNDLEKARDFMQLAAFVHGFNDAIVSLANNALSTSNFDAKKEYKYVISTAEPLIVDMDEIYECGQQSGAHVAMKLYKLAGERGSKEGWFNLGHLLWNGHDLGNEQSIEPDQSLAIECFEQAVVLGDDDARYFLAVCYLAQEGEDDESESVRSNGFKLVQDAADNGHIGALYYLALLYRNGDVGLEIEPSLDSFSEYLDEAADDGHDEALFLRAHCLFHGEDGHEVNMRRALEDFLAAGEAGNSDGLVSAGALYHRGGYDIKKDQRKAFELYQQAGEMGNLEGWRNVVACYALGEGVPQCEKTASYIQKTILDKK
jgi:TPR repeat protein